MRLPLRLALGALLMFTVLCWFLLVPSAHDPEWWKHVGILHHRNNSGKTGGQSNNRPDVIVVDDEVIVINNNKKDAIPSTIEKTVEAKPKAQAVEREMKAQAKAARPPFVLLPGEHFKADYDWKHVTYAPFDETELRKNGKTPKFTFVDPAHPKLNLTIYQLSEHPIVYFIPDFMTDEECDEMVKSAEPGLTRSLVAAVKGRGNQEKDEVRTSSQTWLSTTYGPAATVAQRLLDLTGFARGSEEQMQILRYEVGQKYDAHNDYFDPAMYGPQRTNRALTCFLYLNDVEEGGETWFPRASGKGPTYEFKRCDRGLRVRPIKRSAVLFYGMRPDGTYDDTSLHGGCPVKRGVKWGGTLWFRVNTE